MFFSANVYVVLFGLNLILAGLNLYFYLEVSSNFSLCIAILTGVMSLFFMFQVLLTNYANMRNSGK